jgi:PAS domain S-box-containing protein
MTTNSPEDPVSILVIEPNADVQLALTDLLEAQGYQVRSRATGGEAITALVYESPCAAVILDIALPDMEGTSLLKMVTRFNPLLPVIVLTSLTEVEKKIRVFQHGAAAFILKLYNREELLAVLSRAIAGGQMAQRITEVEQDLQTSEERYQLVVQASKDVIVLADAQGQIIGWNKAAQDLFGYQADEILGRSLTTIMPVRYHAAHLQGIEHYRTTGQARVLGQTLEVQGLRKDGSEIPIELSLSTWSQNEQNVFCGIIRDRTARLQAEQAVQEREQLLDLKYAISQILVERQPLSLILQRCAEAVVTYLDAAFARIWVLDKQAQVLQLQASAGMYTHLDGEHARIALGQYKIGRIAQSQEPHLTNQVQEDPEVHNQEWAKREGMVSFAGYPLMVQEKLVGVLGMFSRHPLTEVAIKTMANIANEVSLVIIQKQGEQQIHHLQKIQHRILDSIQEGIYGLDREGNTTFVNNAASQLLGWQADELIGRCQHELIHHTKPNGSPYPREDCPIYAAFRDGKVHHITNEVFWRKDGTRFPVEYTSSPLRSDDGDLEGAVVVFRELPPQDKRGKKSGHD